MTAALLAAAGSVLVAIVIALLSYRNTQRTNRPGPPRAHQRSARGVIRPDAGDP
jgi:hypothetical protein